MSLEFLKDRISSKEALQDLRKRAKDRINSIPIRVLICAGTGCIAGGAQDI